MLFFTYNKRKEVLFMKKVLTLCVVVLMAIFLMPSIANAASESVTITVVADKTTSNPGDTVNFEVKLGAVEDLGGLDFNVIIPDGLTVNYDSIAMQDGLKDILKSDGNIIVPTKINNLRWCYSVGDESYTGTSELSILSFSCTVNADASFDEKTVTLSMRQCFDGSVYLNDIRVNLVPATVIVEKVKVPVSGVSLNQSALDLRDGESAKLIVAIAPTDADNQNVIWSSDNTTVATVATDGTVNALKEGTANITVTTEDGGKTASCAVTVTCNHAMEKTEAVAATCSKDGNVEYYTCSKCDKIFADEAGTKELTDVVDKAKGHTKTEWLCDETSHWNICSVCGKEFDKADHTYKWIVDQAATEDETGLTHEECVVCGSKRNEDTIIDKLDHVHTNIQHHEAVAATCMAQGNAEYWTCSSEKCNEKYYGDDACQVEIQEVVLPVNPDNHIGTGKWDKTANKHVYICTCGKVLTDEAHKYDNNADADCNVCGYRRFYSVVSGANAVYEIGSENGLTITANGAYDLFKDVEVDEKAVASADYEVKAGSTVVTLKKSYLGTLSTGEHTIRIVYTDGAAATTKFTIIEKNSAGNNSVNSNNTSNDNTDNANTNNNNNVGSGTTTSQEQDGISAPKTGEGNRFAVFVVLAVSSFTALVALLLYNRKRQNR